MSLDVTLVMKTPVFSANITHNLALMAKQAGIYEALWGAEGVRAEDLAHKLDRAIDKLKKDPEYFKKFSPQNGWGSYETLLEFLEQYLEACLKNPDAEVEVCR